MQKSLLPKKNILPLLSAIAAVISVFVVARAFSVARRASPGPVLEEGETFYISGDVQIQKRGSGQWEKAAVDAQINNGDMISTAENSAVEVKFGRDKKNIVACKANTTVALQRLVETGDKRIELQKGDLMTLIARLDDASSFEVRTPTAVCGVSGTGFETQVAANITTLKVYEGSVYVKSLRRIGPPIERLVVEQGHMTTVGKYKLPTAPVKISADDMQQWQEWRSQLAQHLFRTLYVFSDEESTSNHWSPSGWVGDYDAIRRSSWDKDPYAGENCLMFRYTARPTQGAGWVGVYWLNPANNWGDVQGGYDLTGARRLTFWARGDEGNEVILRFGIGGIVGTFPDSSTAEIGPITLTRQWQKYSIDLTGRDLTHISGGFFWMTDSASNPDGAIFFLDEIRYE